MGSVDERGGFEESEVETRCSGQQQQQQTAQPGLVWSAGGVVLGRGWHGGGWRLCWLR